MDSLVVKISRVFLAACFLCAIKGMPQQSKEQESMKDAELVRSATKMLVMVDAFRTQALTNSTLAFSRMGTEVCAKKWTTEIVSKTGEKREMVFSDFFAGATVLMGALTKEKSVVGFYNPWTDALLLGALRIQGEKQPILDDFIFVTGESFRGTPLLKGEALLALYKPERPLMIELAMRYAKTSKMFETFYPLYGEAPLLAPALKACMHPQELEWAYILARQSYRMTMFAALTQKEGRSLYLQMGKLLRGLDGDMKTIGDVVSEEQRPAVLDAVKQLPLALRKNLAPHYAVQAKDGAVLCLVNPEFPRWVIIANYKGAITTESKATIDAFDLKTSKGLIALLKGGKQ
jgi:hypothetical protein